MERKFSVNSNLTVILLIISLIILSSCTSAFNRPIEEPGKVPQPTVSVTKQDWEVEWEKTLKEAKKEGKLVLYLSDNVSASRGPFVKATKQNFGLETEVVVARLAEHSTRVMNERRAGIFYPDIMIGGAGVISFQLRSNGVLQQPESAFILPEVKDTKNWSQGKIPWVDKEKFTLGFGSFISSSADININSVRKEEMTSFFDLLDPRWKGKISMNDPTIAGQGSYWFHMANLIAGKDFARQLARQEPVIIRDMRQQTEWLAQGKYPVALGSSSDFVAEFKKEGAPVDSIIFKEGTAYSSGASNMMLINNTPHPNAARVFINWFLSREGQTLWVNNQTAYFSRRIDVSTEHLDPIFAPGRPGIKYIDMGIEETILERPKYIELAIEILGPLKK